MDIPERVQDQIVAELESHRQKHLDMVRRVKLTSTQAAFDRGIVAGITAAIIMVQSWNDPAHGKVVARPA